MTSLSDSDQRYSPARLAAAWRDEAEECIAKGAPLVAATLMACAKDLEALGREMERT